MFIQHMEPNMDDGINIFFKFTKQHIIHYPAWVRLEIGQNLALNTVRAKSSPVISPMPLIYRFLSSDIF